MPLVFALGIGLLMFVVAAAMAAIFWGGVFFAAAVVVALIVGDQTKIRPPREIKVKGWTQKTNRFARPGELIWGEIPDGAYMIYWRTPDGDGYRVWFTDKREELDASMIQAKEWIATQN